MQDARKIGREIGTALAVLAIYLLTILAPLHHAQASQLDFAAVGYGTVDTGWVLCSNADGTDRSDDVTVTKCPAAGIGKQDLVEPPLDAIQLDRTPSILDAPLVASAPHAVPAHTSRSNSPRGPPVVV